MSSGIRGLLLLLVFCIHGAVAATQTARQNFNYEAFRLRVAKGGDAGSFTIVPMADVPFVLSHGTLSFHGRLFVPPPLAAIQFFPTKMRVAITHRAATGALLWRKTCDLAVQSDGRILHQAFMITDDVVIHRNEKLTCSLIPVDEALPACFVQLSSTLVPAMSAESEEHNPTPPIPRPGLLESSFSLSGAVSAQAQGKQVFHFRLKAPGGNGFFWPSGHIAVAGSLVPASASVPLANRVEMDILHRDPNGKLILTDHDVIQMLSSGKIPLQRFALAVGRNHTREDLEILFVPLDRDIPPGHVQIRFTYSRG